MSCPKSLNGDGNHSWDKLRDGVVKSWWRCERCGKRRKKRHLYDGYSQPAKKNRIR